jgi:geranylgeranylglycerol-phosphate geranylgeranyltransferase
MSAKEKPSARAVLRLLRPGNALVAAVGAYAGALLAGAAAAPSPAVLAAMVAAFAFAAAGNVRNDLGDVAIDRVAHPDRPLVTGAVDPRVARLLAAHLYGMALVAGWLVSWWGLLLVLAALPVMEGYERWGKSRGLPGNLAIGLLTAAPFVLGAMAGGKVGLAVLAVAGLAALATVGREILKDVEDKDADAGHRRTLPMRIGSTRAALVAAGFLGAAALLSPAPLLLENVLGWAYLPAVGLADACFLTAATLGHRAPGRAQRLAKAGMVLALVALAAGRATAGDWS